MKKKNKAKNLVFAFQIQNSERDCDMVHQTFLLKQVGNNGTFTLCNRVLHNTNPTKQT